MILKKIPERLLNISEPWSLTYTRKREYQVKQLNPNIDEYKKAIEAIQICINVISKITPSKDHIFLKKYDQMIWYMYESISNEFLYFKDIKINAFLDSLDGLDGIEVTSELVNMFFLAWLDNRVRLILYNALDWIGKRFSKNNNSEIFNGILNLAKNHWQTSDSDIANHILMAAVSVCGKKIYPLLDSIISDPNVDGKLRETVLDYRTI